MSRALIPFTEITAAAVMAALEAGRSIGAITTGRDGGPLVARLYKLREYMVANPEWARAIEPLIKKNFVAAQKQKGHNRNQTHCKRGHDLAIHAYPNRPNGIWRKCRLCNDMRAKMGGEPKPELVARVKAALEAGKKISDLTKAGQPGYIVKHPTLMRMKREIPEVGQLIDRRLTQYYTGTVTEDRVRSVLEGLSHGMTLHQLTTRSTPAYLPTTEPVVNFAGLYKFMEKHPTLGKRMRALSAKNAKSNYSQVRTARRSIASDALLRNGGLDAYEAVQRATAHIWIGERGDAQTLMFIAIGEKRLTLRGCTRDAANLFLKESKRRPRVFGDAYMSLDAPLNDDTDMTRMDKVTTMLWKEPA